MRRVAWALLIALAAALALHVRLVAPPAAADRHREPVTGMEFVRVPPGAFAMGSLRGEPGRQDDETPHRVRFTGERYVGRYEVTQAQWQQVMGDNPSHQRDCPRCPVERVSFHDVRAFLARFNDPVRGWRYRLPTEAEWEYACRAGTATPFHTGDGLDTARANVDGGDPEAGGTPGGAPGRTLPVGSFPPNAWGLHDMHGNVWEWTADWYGPYSAAPVTNPVGPASGEKRVIRGGSWYFDAGSARCALRYTHAPGDRGFSLGFRLLAEPFARAGQDTGEAEPGAPARPLSPTPPPWPRLPERR